MSLFDCIKCDHVENTVMAPWYGMRGIAECSLCHEGVWHGEFDRRIRTPEQRKIGLPAYKPNLNAQDT